VPDNPIRRLLRDEDGATAMEYALMAAAVAGVIIAVAFLAGGKVKNSINNVAAHIN
jgi:Flp pilus assembly pilin Flp